MEESILKGTKKILGIGVDDISFDHDVITHINSAFSTLSQLCEGLLPGIIIEDDSAEWEILELSPYTLGLIKTYIYLKVRMLFDPPATSFVIDAMNKQIAEHEFRLSIAREPEVEIIP